MDWGWKEYVPVAKRRANAMRFAQQLAKKEGRRLEPISIEGRKIAGTFWGQAWCDNLERYSDFANRLPRGRTYVRNGSVVDLLIQPGLVRAYVSGSEIYQVTIEISRLKPKVWKQITADCVASIDSLLDLLGGRFADGVMQRLTRQGDGLFPQPSEIEIACSCPDWAGLCKHAAAVLYGVGARLDSQAELLFRLRGVDHAELVSHAVSAENLERALGGQKSSLATEDLGELFGIEMESATHDKPSASTKPARRGSTKKETASAASAQSLRKSSAAKINSARKPAASTVVRKSAKRKPAAKPPASSRKKATAVRKVGRKKI